MKKAFRVKKNREIEGLLKHQNKKRSQHFTCYKKPNNLPHYRFALSVSKKFGKAHHRNKMKRQVRMIVGQMKLTESVDLFLVVQPLANNLTFQEIEKELNELFTKHKLIEVKQ